MAFMLFEQSRSSTYAYMVTALSAVVQTDLQYGQAVPLDDGHSNRLLDAMAVSNDRGTVT